MANGGEDSGNNKKGASYWVSLIGGTVGIVGGIFGIVAYTESRSIDVRWLRRVHTPPQSECCRLNRLKWASSMTRSVA
jgi:hypothetical protein